MAMTKTARETALRSDFMTRLIALFPDEEILRVGSNEIAIPCIDAEGYEAWINVKVSTPRGTRDGNGGYNDYDGYAAAEEYKAECEIKEEKRKAAEAKKAAKIAKDKAKREAAEKDKDDDNQYLPREVSM